MRNVFSETMKMSDLVLNNTKLLLMLPRFDIKLGFGDAEALSYCGDTIATWKSPKPSEKFDDKAFKADHPDLFKEYAKTVQGARRFFLK